MIRCGTHAQADSIAPSAHDHAVYAHPLERAEFEWLTALWTDRRPHLTNRSAPRLTQAFDTRVNRHVTEGRPALRRADADAEAAVEAVAGEAA
jgi:hypothetical protein